MKKRFFSENTSFWLAISGFIVLIITIALFLGSYGLKEVDSSRFDHFGSFIGGLVGAMWSLASFILLYISLQKQEQALTDQKTDLELTRKALHLQIEEFELQRKELEGTKIALEEQSKTQELQRFETTFFKLLELHNNITLSLKTSIKKRRRKGGLTGSISDGIEEYEVLYQGKDIFVKIYSDLESYFNRSPKNNYDNKYFDDLYKFGCFENEQKNLAHYFRNLYQILKFIENSQFEEDAKYFYSNLLRAQLSLYELAILFYNCLSSIGDEKFKPLIEKYHFLQNIDINILFDLKHQNMYHENAFK